MSNIRSEALVNGERVSRKPSAMISRRAVERSRTVVERGGAWGILALGLMGTVIALHGGWDAMLRAPSWERAIAAVALQAALTWSQWAYGDRPLISWPSRALDAALTAAGWAPLWIGALAGLLGALGVEGAPVVWRWAVPLDLAAAWVLSWAVCLIPAWLPEDRLLS